MEAFALIAFAVLLAGIAVLYCIVHGLTLRVTQAEKAVEVCMMTLMALQEGQQVSVRLMRQEGGPTSRH